MKTSAISALILVGFVSNSISFREFLQHGPLLAPSEDVGDPLLLSPLINAGRIEEAQNLSRVTDLTDVLSYSGYITVNEQYDSNMFFWFFPAMLFLQVRTDEAPLLIWLQGGPGASSMYGLFTINGPFIVNADLSVIMRNTSWTLTHSVVYFDNPVGTGFSYTKSENGYARNQTDIARDLYAAITQFLVLFPEYKQRDLYLTGESYAGKYVPAIAYKIHMENQNSTNEKINLKGLAIGNGLTDPISQLGYGEVLFHLGYIDTTEMSFIAKEEEKAKQLILQGMYSDAFAVMEAILFGGQGKSYIFNITGLEDIYNYYLAKSKPEDYYYYAYVQSDAIRRAIHVGASLFGGEGASKVEAYLRNDIYQSVKPWLEELLDAPEQYKILIYTGNLDIVCASALTEKMINTFNWSGAAEFAQTSRKIWRISNNNVAGYTKTVGSFSHVVIRNAGHAAPADQPDVCFEMINKFTQGSVF